MNNQFLILNNHIINVEKIDLIKIQSYSFEVIMESKTNTYACFQGQYDNLPEGILEKFFKFSYFLEKKDGYIMDLLDIKIAVPRRKVLHIYKENDRVVNIQLVGGKKYRSLEKIESIIERLNK